MGSQAEITDPTPVRIGPEDVLQRLVESRNWLVWTATAMAPETGEWLKWRFDDDFCEYLPPWFDIERVGNHATSLTKARIEDEHLECNTTALDAVLSGAPSYRQLFRIRLRDGRISWIEERVSIKQIGPRTWRLVGLCVDATERKEAEERRTLLNEELQAIQMELETHNEELQAMREKLQADTNALADANKRLAGLATTDGLTGVKNHRAFQVQLEREYRASDHRNRPLSLVMLDIDHFKQFNDEFGHPAGDGVLREICRILERNVRQTDFIARYGGEEFVIILPETDIDGAIILAERFRYAIEHSPWAKRAITASFGVATRGSQVLTPDFGTDLPPATPQHLITEADRALYQAKANGRNYVCHAMNLSLARSIGG
ncbi:MAG: GGDEF domain-containing protein [Capsulimonadaceae bacterium]